MSPKEFGEKLNTVVEAWKTLRPAKKFGGMTLEEFQNKVKPSLDARAELDRLDKQMTAQMDLRDDADKASAAELALVVNGVKSDREEGEDGELYEAMGYVRKSERKTGLTRKKAAPPEKK
jgi:hypothetical protein